MTAGATLYFKRLSWSYRSKGVALVTGLIAVLALAIGWTVFTLRSPVEESPAKLGSVNAAEAEFSGDVKPDRRDQTPAKVAVKKGSPEEVQIHVTIRTTPVGVFVTDEKGDVLGMTPLELSAPEGYKQVLNLYKKGYEPHRWRLIFPKEDRVVVRKLAPLRLQDAPPRRRDLMDPFRAQSDSRDRSK